jgi:hypothetical protein
MQTVQRYLINNLVIAYISGYHGRNSKVYDRRLTLHRGVSNPISFTFKNEDQKAQDITTKTLTILDDGSTVSTKGDASCTITEGDLLPLDSKFYNFAVREVKADGSREVTYADTGYAAAGTIEVLDSAYPEFVSSVSVTNFTVTADSKSLARLSGVVDSRPGINNNKALHSIAVYTKNFSGNFKVQATMVSSPSQPTDFFDVALTGDALSSTGVTTYNFTGVYHNVRFTWENNTGNTGRVDKILYRQ